MSGYAWVHKVKLPGAGATITGTMPGTTIAKAVKEIQDAVVMEIESDDIEVSKDGNTVTLKFKYGTAGGGAALPAPGSRYMVLQLNDALDAEWGYLKAHD